jgi:hypothetical protein
VNVSDYRSNPKTKLTKILKNFFLNNFSVSHMLRLYTCYYQYNQCLSFSTANVYTIDHHLPDVRSISADRRIISSNRTHKFGDYEILRTNKQWR